MSRSGLIWSTVRITSSNRVTSPRISVASLGIAANGDTAPGFRSMQTTRSPRSINRLMSRGPMNPVPPITSIAIAPFYPGRPALACGCGLGTSVACRQSSGKPVVGGAVVPQDLLLALLGDRQLEGRLHRARELRVAVREIRREHDPVVADGLDDVPHRLLVAFYRHEALPLEVRAGSHREVPGVDVAQPFHVLVHAPEQERHPAAVAFEEGHAQARMALQDTARAERAHGEHLLDGMRVHVLQQRVGAELLADLPQLRTRPLVEAQRDLELLEFSP